MSKIRTFRIQFKNELGRHEIPLFRGAVIASVGRDDDVLFHNHVGEGFRYGYPLIQYKRIHKCASILCVKEGTETIGDFFSSNNFQFQIGERNVSMEVESVKAEQTEVQLWGSMFKYSIRRWLPFNSDNYRKYTQMEGLAEKSEFLEKILKGNILSFLKGVGIFLDQELQCKITQLSEPLLVKNKGVRLMSFDACFMSNISLPDYIGLGKNVSIGFGTTTRIFNREEE
jgi:hypothetical protein